MIEIFELLYFYFKVISQKKIIISHFVLNSLTFEKLQRVICWRIFSLEDIFVANDYLTLCM